MDNNYGQFGEEKERFFSDAYAPLDTPTGWNKWYQEYRRYILKLPKEHKPKYKKFNKR